MEDSLEKEPVRQEPKRMDLITPKTEDEVSPNPYNIHVKPKRNLKLEVKNSLPVTREPTVKDHYSTSHAKTLGGNNPRFNNFIDDDEVFGPF